MIFQANLIIFKLILYNLSAFCFIYVVIFLNRAKAFDAELNNQCSLVILWRLFLLKVMADFLGELFVETPKIENCQFITDTEEHDLYL